MTLTTEQLRERIGHLKERLHGMKQHKYPDDCHNAKAYLESLKAERQQDIALLEELLANREAQPVAWTSQRSLETKCKIVAFTDDASALDYGVAKGWEDIVELYTAPPAPAATPPISFSETADADMCREWAWKQVKEMLTPDGWTVGDNITYFGFFCWGWDMRRQYNEQRPPAPAVPPEASPDDIPQEHNINTYSGITWAASWNACRAAMLAETPPAPAIAIPEKVSCEGFNPKDWVEARNLGQREGWNAYRAAMLAATPPALRDGYCLMPRALTAEKGAKYALSGEFKVSRTVTCNECGGDGCNDCGDAGEFEEEITVPWDTIKEIYRAAVGVCAQPNAAPEGGN